MISSTADFATSRLRVRSWHGARSPSTDELVRIVMRIMTSPVTRALPTQWQGDYTVERAQAWIAARDNEGATLLVSELASDEAIGFVILFESPVDGEPREVNLRLGYLLAETAWGQGYGTELVAGLIDWCRSRPEVRSIAGGVASHNVASARVLIKNGFAAVGGETEGEQHYELILQD